MKDLVRYDVKGSGLLCHRIIKDKCKAIVFDDFSIQTAIVGSLTKIGIGEVTVQIIERAIVMQKTLSIRPQKSSIGKVSAKKFLYFSH